jgi:thiamine-monophosphate kinase
VLLDALRMARASGLCLAIRTAAVPLACPESRRSEALRWGDDYELLFTLPAGIAPAVPATCIGEATAGPPGSLEIDGVSVLSPENLGFEHR